jgi:hypothetical protein
VTISKELKLYMPSKYQSSCIKSGDFCAPQSSLFLIQNQKKIDISNLIEKWNGSFFVYFVKISEGKYADDLDKDGRPEIAIFPMVAGNTAFGSAIIYTVKEDNLHYYGLGTLQWEYGPHVTNIIRGKNKIKF